MLLLAPVSDTPEEHLAWDEALLDWAESGEGGEALWFWESTVPFVAVGYGQSVQREVNVAQCDARGIPVLRRCSGGGTVVQGPGCLNYGLVLRITTPDPAATISTANASIMERQRRALATLMSDEVAVSGHTDLAVAGRKFSGNSQRRRQGHLLFHGTILLNLDLELIDLFLKSPSRSPQYRAGRAHQEFVFNTGLRRQAVEAALRAEWKANGPSPPLPTGRMQDLVAAKYGRPEWNRRW
jgi:lipoate-protein ligase A